MARHARSHGAPAAPAQSARQRRAQARARKAEQRRLAEREQVSGEIRTPDEITARRARRAEKPRPAAPAPSSRTPVSARTLVPERTFSGRMIVLTIVALVVISFLVPTVRTYLQQQAEISELREQIAAEQQRQGELYTELQRWDDPEFVRQQARERINLVMPGERRYHVMGDLSDVEVESASDVADPEDPAWTDELWESVVESAAE
ncbi:septum formation initiator family protein [Nesterenkonia sp.]|uniref:FtsB family cell division protein n=1 Tax=Nesterenkonia sp. TaxID=704201 RepID=UPI002613419C|nr:septum formation initiator family protein [Nesterenkonia sp.]